MIGNSDKEKIIIEAARRRFARYGFNKVTMDEIAADIEMGKASLYYYFPTKESIFKQVILQEQAELENEIRTIILKNISCGDKLIEYVNKRLNYFEKLVNLGTLSIYSFMDTKSVYRELFSQFQAKETSLIDLIVNDGIKRGEFKKDLDKKTSGVILHVLQGLRLVMLRQYRDIELNEKMIGQLRKEMLLSMKLILNGILNGRINGDLNGTE